jgi:hypothetical protein
LSARSYLELGRDELQAQVQLQSHPAEYKSISNPSVSALSGGLIDAPSKSGPHLRPRPRPREPRLETIDQYEKEADQELRLQKMRLQSKYV